MLLPIKSNYQKRLAHQKQWQKQEDYYIRTVLEKGHNKLSDSQYHRAKVRAPTALSRQCE